jgi:hypothetical protein
MCVLLLPFRGCEVRCRQELKTLSLFFLFIYFWFNRAVRYSDYMAFLVKMLAENELDRIWKKSVAGYFRYRPDVSLDGLANNKNRPQYPVFLSRLNVASSECCVGVLTGRARSSIYCYYRTHINEG